MPKIILLPVTCASSDADMFATALSVAAAFDAHIVGLHVRPDIRRDISSLAASDGGMTAGIDTVLEKMEGDADAREKTAIESLKTIAAAVEQYRRTYTRLPESLATPSQKPS